MWLGTENVSHISLLICFYLLQFRNLCLSWVIFCSAYVKILSGKFMQLFVCTLDDCAWSTELRPWWDVWQCFCFLNGRRGTTIPPGRLSSNIFFFPLFVPLNTCYFSDRVVWIKTTSQFPCFSIFWCLFFIFSFADFNYGSKDSNLFQAFFLQ